MTRTPALTLHRPWTACITSLPDGIAKRVENRSWSTNHRGPLLLHAGQHWDRNALPIADRIAASLGVDTGLLPYDKAAHPTGFVAVADLLAMCDRSARSGRLLCDCGPWATAGQYHWLLDNVRPLAEPVPWPGAQGLWWPPDTAIVQVGEQVPA